MDKKKEPKKDEWKQKLLKLEDLKKGLNYKWPRVNTDGFVAFLHYRITVCLLVGSAGVLMFKQFYGDSIQCHSTSGDNLNAFADLYCLLHSTYTVPNFDPRVAAHPGVAPIRTPVNPGEVKTHRYYLWVSIALFLLGWLFYLPKYFWKECEIGQMKLLMDSLYFENLEKKLEGEPVDVKTRKLLAKISEYFIVHLGFNEKYFYCHLLTEFLYLTNVFAQIIFLDNFLGNEFSIYGKQVIGFTNQDPEVRVDAIEAMFPKVTKCTFVKYGPSGEPINHDFICLLPLNVVYEKILIWIWCWFLLLAVLTSVSVVFWMLYVISPRLRFHLLMPPRSSAWICDVLLQELTVGDVFFLYVLKWNLDPESWPTGDTMYEILLDFIGHRLEAIQLERDRKRALEQRYRRHISA